MKIKDNLIILLILAILVTSPFFTYWMAKKGHPQSVWIVCDILEMCE